jgi:DNA-binding NarL/FixJ family response regulator
LPGDVLGAIQHLTNGRDDFDVIAIADCEAGGELGAVRAGATGVVYRDTALEQLPHALAAVLAGETAIPRRLLPALLAELRIPRPRLAAKREQVRLTQREREVLDGLVDGMTTRDIAAELFVAPVTVRTHVCALLRKLGLADRDALIEWARHAREARIPA